jgi:GNAT superfamily N-acetyltransferase
VQPGDLDFVKLIYRSTRDDLSQLDAEDEFIDILIEQQFQAQAHSYEQEFPSATHLIIEHQAQSVGRLILDFGSDSLNILDVALSRDMRGRGLGSHLLRGLQEAAVRVGAPLHLSVDPANVGAHRLYLQLGFVQIGTMGLNFKLEWNPQFS